MSEVSIKELLQASESRRRFAAENGTTADENEYQAFRFGRVGSRPQLMICFVKADGFHLVLPYADLRRLQSSDPSRGFTVDIAQSTISVEGQNLEPCFRYIRDQRLADLVEAESAFQAPSSDTLVSKLFIRPIKPGGSS